MSQSDSGRSSDFAHVAERSSAPDDPGSVSAQILVIDDDAAVDEGFAELLASAGYAVHSESTRIAGLAYLEGAEPSALILDLHLSDGTGLECLRQLRQMPRHRDLPVAIVTGDYFLDEEIAKELQILGARVFFKPVWAEDLLRIVGELLASRRNGRADGEGRAR
jgi:CheY-like chemotaxis protein